MSTAGTALSTGPTVGMNSHNPAMNASANGAFTPSSSNTIILTTPITTIAIICVTSHLRSTVAIPARISRACARDVAGTTDSSQPRYTSGSAPMYIARNTISTKAATAASVFDTKENRYRDAPPSPSVMRFLIASLGDAAIESAASRLTCAAVGGWVLEAGNPTATGAITAVDPAPAGGAAADLISVPTSPVRFESIHVWSL
ncbi:MAG: hypothetical protein CK550_04760 [Gemmatimonadetes bacterium]|nr:MAG: hypothetical protein CK550_04760 [Gemmatimonadota bacterium]